MHHIPDRQFDDFSAQGTRDVGHRDNFFRYVTPGGVDADGVADARFQIIAEPLPFAQYDKQHDAYIIPPYLTDAQTFEHRIHFFHLPIYFRGADAHPARIQNRVRAPVDDNAVMVGDFGVIALGPDIFKPRKICIMITAPVGFVPEAQRHAGKGLGAYQLAPPPAHRSAVFIDVHRHAEAAALNLAAINRPQGIADDETGNDVGAAGNG